MLAITDASAGADPLGYVISVTNDVASPSTLPPNCTVTGDKGTEDRLSA